MNKRRPEHSGDLFRRLVGVNGVKKYPELMEIDRFDLTDSGVGPFRLKNSHLRSGTRRSKIRKLSVKICGKDIEGDWDYSLTFPKLSQCDYNSQSREVKKTYAEVLLGNSITETSAYFPTRVLAAVEYGQLIQSSEFMSGAPIFNDTEEGYSGFPESFVFNSNAAEEEGNFSAIIPSRDEATVESGHLYHPAVSEFGALSTLYAEEPRTLEAKTIFGPTHLAFDLRIDLESEVGWEQINLSRMEAVTGAVGLAAAEKWCELSCGVGLEEIEVVYGSLAEVEHSIRGAAFADAGRRRSTCRGEFLQMKNRLGARAAEAWGLAIVTDFFDTCCLIDEAFTDWQLRIPGRPRFCDRETFLKNLGMEARLAGVPLAVAVKSRGRNSRRRVRVQKQKLQALERERLFDKGQVEEAKVGEASGQVEEAAVGTASAQLVEAMGPTETVLHVAERGRWKPVVKWELVECNRAPVELRQASTSTSGLPSVMRRLLDRRWCQWNTTVWRRRVGSFKGHEGALPTEVEAVAASADAVSASPIIFKSLIGSKIDRVEVDAMGASAASGSGTTWGPTVVPTVEEMVEARGKSPVPLRVHHPPHTTSSTTHLRSLASGGSARGLRRHMQRIKKLRKAVGIILPCDTFILSPRHQVRPPRGRRISSRPRPGVGTVRAGWIRTAKCSRTARRLRVLQLRRQLQRQSLEWPLRRTEKEVTKDDSKDWEAPLEGGKRCLIDHWHNSRVPLSSLFHAKWSGAESYP